MSDTSFVQFVTNQGNINVQMLSYEAPLNVANFLGYVKSGAYINSIFHRSISGFISQGGGFTVSNGAPSAIAAGSAVAGEHGTGYPNAFSNVRGTLALALSNGPSSGTNEWFFNLEDNNNSSAPNNLDEAAGGGPFTVFGVVADSSSLAVVDQIAAVPDYDASSYFASLYGKNFPSGAFTDLPLIDFTSTPLATDNFVVVTAILPYTPFSAWQSAAFANDATDSLPGATPQNDSTPNLVKYALGVTPDQPISTTDRAKLPAVKSITVSGANYMVMTYHQRPNLALTGAAVTVETSSDLVNWAPPTNAVTTQTGTDSGGDAIMQVQVPAATSGSEFIRLIVTQQ